MEDEEREEGRRSGVKETGGRQGRKGKIRVHLVGAKMPKKTTLTTS